MPDMMSGGKGFPMGARSDLPVADRREAVLSLLRKDEPAALVARRYKVSEQTLYRWRDDFLAAGEAGLTRGANGRNPEAKRIAELEGELAERDRVIGELTIANRILKKVRAGRL